MEGLFAPSPHVDPRKEALIKLLLFKPLHAAAKVDALGEAIDPYEDLYKHRDTNKNPYDAFPATWRHYWRETVLLQARAADEKLKRRMEWPSIWECTEVFLALMKITRQKPFHDSSMSADEQQRALKESSDVQAKLEDRLSIQEYCCYTIRRVATNLDAFARSKAAPKTKKLRFRCRCN